MNRIRKFNNIYQIIISPDIVNPNLSLFINYEWHNNNIHNCSIVESDDLSDAQYISLQYPDINWDKIIYDHQYEYVRLKNQIDNILKQFDVYTYYMIMTPDTLKNSIFNKILNPYTDIYGYNNIITYIITHPFSAELHRIIHNIEIYREHLVRDDLRLRQKKTFGKYLTCLYGVTTLGSIYEIKIMPALIYNWLSHKNKYKNDASQMYIDYCKMQDQLDNNNHIVPL